MNDDNAEYPPPKPGEPALHRAARLGDVAAIRRLVAHGAALDASFDIGLDPGAVPNLATSLMVAAGSGDGAHANTVRLFLELGANPLVTLGPNTAAAFACTGLGWNYRPGGDAARLRLLLESGSTLPAQPSVAHRLLCDVAATGDIDRLDILLEQGLSPSGYWEANEARQRAVALQEQMRQFRASLPDPFAAMPEEVLATLAQSMAEMETQQLERQVSSPFPTEIPLFRAAKSGNVACVKRLLSAGADPLARDNSRRTAMYHASSQEVIQALEAAGTPLEDSDAYEWSPLSAAVAEGQSAVPRIRALLAAGANVHAVHDRGYTVFMSAVSSTERSVDILRLLTEAGADPHAVSHLGYNAFHAAVDVNGEANAEASVRTVLSYLKELGIDLECRNHRDETPLARAIHEGTELEVKVLREERVAFIVSLATYELWARRRAATSAQ